MDKGPYKRPRRLRAGEAIRGLVREASIDTAKLIQPMFVIEGHAVEQPIDAMPGQHRYSVDRCVEQCKRMVDAGVPAILLFGVPNHKDYVASAAYAGDGVVQRATAAIKKACPKLLVMTDVCLCAYMIHGHCGVVEGERVDNDASVELLCRTAVSHAKAGADFVAPSDMMDGRVAAIRRALDAGGHGEIGILSYAVKYASAFFGPFREAAGSAPAFGDRRGYQMDPGNAREGVKVVALAGDEGADIVMVKPALPYLDVIHRVRASTNLPVAAYQVSGEYAMIEAAAAQGWINRGAAVRESLLSIRRAGADMIITYYAAALAAGTV